MSNDDFTYCPKCHRPMNEGNSPNDGECTETDDDEGLCRAFSVIYHLQGKLDGVRKAYENGGGFGLIEAIKEIEK